MQSSIRVGLVAGAEHFSYGNRSGQIIDNQQYHRLLFI